jgi:hypothetical protein
VPGDIARHLAAARRVTDMHSIFDVKRCDEFGNVGGVGVHVVPVHRPSGTTMPAAIMSDHPVTVVKEEHHYCNLFFPRPIPVNHHQCCADRIFRRQMEARQISYHPRAWEG